MLSKQSVSVTELRKNTKKVFEKLKNEWELFICMYNKPVAILKDLKDSSLNTKVKFDFDFWKEGIDADLILNYFKQKNNRLVIYNYKKRIRNESFFII